ncbi:ATP-binding protein [Paraoerskovia marina]|uniref:Signal transduction histidine-protein kinase/phosphatase MprB n=1 Tax=Paraoerskovia marina TaxID=545619 RepID=A0A1H1QSN7_9CELL|nr:ATP-binding protein [Paraoerskovia marina]SDS26425.1 Signal transduction histidine kinase [Paraoerskovia marina]
MRRRLLTATVSAVLVAVLLLGLPLAFIGARFVEDIELRELTARSEALGRQIDSRTEAGEEVPQSTVDNAATGTGRLDAYITVLTSDGQVLYAGEELSGDTVTRTLTTDDGSLVTLSVPSYQITLREAQIVFLVAVATVVAFGAGIAVSVWQSNRLSAPLVYLAASAEQLGSGQVRPRLEDSGVEEIDLVADELARSADRMATRLAAERQFASDASHQLRTPLTALSMRLEEISMASDDEAVQEEARISLEQIERLVGVVDDLLLRSRSAVGGTTEPVLLIEIGRQLEEEYGPTFERGERRLVIDIPDSAQALATPGGLAQVLATLVENSLKHGGGTTTVRTRSGGERGTVVIEVADEGDGVPEDLAPHIFERSVTSGAGTGLGLALARDLVAADGGRIKLSQRVPAVFSIFLAGVPRTLDPNAVLPTGRTLAHGRKGWFGRP